MTIAVPEVFAGRACHGLDPWLDDELDASKNRHCEQSEAIHVLQGLVNAGLPHPLCGFAMTIIRLFELSDCLQELRWMEPALGPAFGRIRGIGGIISRSACRPCRALATRSVITRIVMYVRP